MDGAPPERESAPVTESGRHVCALRLRWRFPIEPLKSGAVAFVVGTLDLNDDLEHPSAIALGASDQTRKRLQSLLQNGTAIASAFEEINLIGHPLFRSDARDAHSVRGAADLAWLFAKYPHNRRGHFIGGLFWRAYST